MTPKKLLQKVFPPMLATLAAEAPRADRGWIYELKYDGFRVVAAVSGGDVAMLSRNELDLAPRFPRIAAALAKLKEKEVVLDGEIVVLDAEGAPRFQLLQQGGREQLFVFDILWRNGEDLRALPYSRRRAILETLKLPEGIALTELLSMEGDEALRRAAENGWEGIIAKRTDAGYQGRRSKDWLKVKAIQQQELAIVGWQPSSANDNDIGSLHLAYFDDAGDLRYAGKVGTGFSAKMRTWMRNELMKDRVEKTPVVDAPRIRTATWVKPRLVAQVSFTEWTSDNRLRHPSFLGLREDKAPEDVVREKPMAASSSKTKMRGKKAATPAAAEKGAKRTTNAAATPVASRVTLTSPDRLLYPRDGITKAEVAAYYEAVARPMLRALADRPLALEHWNQGIAKPSWFHQNIGSEGADWMTYVETPTRTSKRVVKHLVVDSVDSLRWLAQMSVLTVHMWSSRAGSLEEPDWLVFDLDPAKGKGIEQAIEAAIVMRGLLENLDVPSVPKTSGKRGIHVFIPLKGGYSHEEVADFALSVASAVSAQVPAMTVERSLAKRRGRLYLDALQNGYGKTVVAPYSPRGIDGAPVSAPLRWSEITKKLDPLAFNIRTMPKRLDKVGDLFEDALTKGVKLPKLK